jgi:hypothetical protein
MHRLLLLILGGLITAGAAAELIKKIHNRPMSQQQWDEFLESHAELHW